jgi:hypothetical protein
MVTPWWMGTNKWQGLLTNLFSDYEHYAYSTFLRYKLRQFENNCVLGKHPSLTHQDFATTASS